MILQVQGLSFDYPRKRALDGVSFGIERGSIVAVIGRNGAGKTTLLRCLAALERPFGGTITIDGIDVLTEPRLAHRKVGFLQDFFGLYEGLTVVRCLDFAARARDVPKAERASSIAWAAKRLGIADRMDQLASSLSRGLRQRLAIAQTIIHRPAVLLLDEPAAGLDPEARDDLSRLIRSLRDDGHTLLVSSHIVEDLRDYSTHLIIVDDGRVIENTALDALAKASAQRIRISFSRPVGVVDLAAAHPALRWRDELTAEAVLTDDESVRLDILRGLLRLGLPVLSFAPEEIDLSRYYLEQIAAGHRMEAP